MKILVVGSGGREHAIAWRLAQDAERHELYCAPGNAGTAAIATNVALAADDIEGIAAWSTMNHPDLVLADEPSGNLDEANSAKLNELFGELNEKFNQAFLIVTHDEKLASFAKRRVVMHNGLIQNME